MTEDEWLMGSDPTPMLAYHWDKMSDRKLRLFGIACVRFSWHRLKDERSKNAVETAEQFVEGTVDIIEVQTAADGAFEVRDELFDLGNRYQIGERVDLERRLDVANAAAFTAAGYGGGDYPIGYRPYPDCFPSNKPRVRCTYLRDIFGNPFHPVVADPAWFAPTVVSIADALYRDRAFDRLPILADALEEAGCTNADLLLHCRQPGEHVRGCWAVDLVLGKV